MTNGSQNNISLTSPLHYLSTCEFIICLGLWWQLYLLGVEHSYRLVSMVYSVACVSAVQVIAVESRFWRKLQGRIRKQLKSKSLF